MPNFDTLMKENKETLATRLVNRSNGSRTSKFNPFKSDGLNIVVGGQELGLIGAAVEDTTRWGYSPHDLVKTKGDRQWGKALQGFVENCLDWDRFSGKLVIGSTGLGFLANAVKRRGKTIRSGLFKLC